MSQPHIVPTHQLKKLIPHSQKVAQIISSSDLDRIRQNSLCIKQAESDQNERTFAKIDNKEVEIQARNTRLQQAETTRLQQMPKTSSEKLQEMRKQSLNNNLTRVTVERDDVAKLLNTLSIEAKVNAVRDRQAAISIRSKIESELEKEKDKKINIETIQQLKDEENRRLAARQRQLEQLKSAAETETQRKERQKLLDEEEKLREGEEFKKFIAGQTELQKQLFAEQQAERQRRSAEVVQINNEQLRLKEMKKTLEKDEDDKILQHIKHQDWLEQEKERKRQEDEKKKNADWAKSLEVHSQNSNALESIENARERSALEKAEKEFLRKERELREKAMRQRQELLQAKQLSEREKEIRRQKIEKEMARELQVAKETKREWELTLLEERERSCTKALQLKDMYEEQIKQRADRLAKENPKDNELEEIKVKEARMKEMLEALRQEKISELKKAGVDEKYYQNLIKFDIEKHLKK